MILATQAVDDFASADLLRTVVESCPTKLLLANPALDRPAVHGPVPVERDRARPHLGPHAATPAAAEATGYRQSPDTRVDPRSYWLYTNTPVDNERVRAVFREYGFEAGLDRLAASA